MASLVVSLIIRLMESFHFGVFSGDQTSAAAAAATVFNVAPQTKWCWSSNQQQQQPQRHFNFCENLLEILSHICKLNSTLYF